MSSFNALSDLENLRLFIQGRIQSVDPSLDTTTGSEMDTAVIQPILDRLGPDPYDVPIRDFILGRIGTEFPDLVLQDGEPIDDYAVKVMQILLEPFRRQIRQISTNQTSQDPNVLNDDEADKLAANFFVSRKLGGFAVGAARLYYSAPQFSLISPANVIKTGTGLRFFPVESQAISLDSMLFNVEDNLFFFDVIVRAEAQGSDYNIPANNLTSIDDAPAVVKVSNKSAFEEGGDREDTTAFLERVEESLTEKSLVTLRGIRARLTEVFESIRLLAVIGMGDPEMQRDIIEGASQSAPFGYFLGTTPAGAGGTPELDLASIMDANGFPKVDVLAAGVQIGDLVVYFDISGGATSEHVITRIVDDDSVEVEPNLPNSLAGATFLLRKPSAGITISDIPGGITGGAAFDINSGEVHIGGALDVYVRGGDPLPRDTILEGVLDGTPLHFGVDLESFGEVDPPLTHLRPPLVDQAKVLDKDRYGTPLASINQLAIRSVRLSDETIPWSVTEDDVGKFIQLLGDGGGVTGAFGTFEILSVEHEEYQVSAAYVRSRTTRVTIDLDDQESGVNPAVLPASTGLDTHFRIVDKVSRGGVVRDRDASRITVVEPPDVLAGVDFSVVGAVVGDSVVIETGDDAGIYSVRRVLSWVDTNDSLLLDRDLTKTLHPSGVGDGTGLRYRIADELNIDLVNPRVTKVPLGAIFAGDDLDTVAGSPVVTVSSSTNFLLAGVEGGDTLEIADGDNRGVYGIISVTGTTATLDASMASAAFNIDFSVYKAYTGIERPLVRVKAVELLDSNSQPTGITIPYGDAVDARVLGILGNRSEGTEVESFTGVSADFGGNLIRLSDANRDFVAEGILSGYRLNILNTLNAGEYTVAAVTTGFVDVELEADGGLEFRTAEGGIHYTIGLPSSGFARLYFQEPTSVEITTGLVGARLETGEGPAKEFRFSEVEGYRVLPSGGSDDMVLRDIRVMNSEDVGGGDFNTIVELTDENNPTVFESEILPGDVLAVHEEIKFRNLKALNATLTWNGTATVTATAVDELDKWHYIRLDSNGVWFQITDITGLSVTIDIAPGTPPSGATASSVSATFKQLSIFGTPAGVRTVAGSALVTVPTGSFIDFTAMRDIDELVGQQLYINSGLDEGVYAIEEVVSGKKLRIDTVMTTTTETVINEGLIDPTQSPQRDAYLEPSGSKTNLTDPTNSPGTVLEQKVTIYESTRGNIDGTYEITGIPSPGATVELDADPTTVIENPKDLRFLIGVADQDDGDFSAGLFSDPDDNLRDAGVFIGDTVTALTGPSAGRYVVRTHPTAGVGGTMTVSDVTGAAPADDAGFDYEVEASGEVDAFAVGRFNWVLTAKDDQVDQPFRIYNAAPTEVAVLEVAPVDALKLGPEKGTVLNATGFEDLDVDFVAAGVVRGDLLEVIAGDNFGVYSILSLTTTTLTIHGAPSPNLFSIPGTENPYRVWGGLLGSPRTLKVGPFQSFNGRLELGIDTPYTLRRPGVFRFSSTEMEHNLDSGLYYTDIQIESQGSGDVLNLPENTRMAIESGAFVKVDGYTYTVDNNRLTFSPFEEVSINFDRRFLPTGNSDSPDNLTEISGRNLKITFESSTVARLVNDLMRSDFERPINADPLGRHFLPSYLFTTLEYSGGLTAEKSGNEVEEYVNQLGSLSAVEVSDLEAILTRRGATYVKHPIVLTAITHDIDRNLIVDRSEDSLGGSNKVSFNGSGRISAFFAILGEGLTVVRL